jgi:hypothetical protein
VSPTSSAPRNNLPGPETGSRTGSLPHAYATQISVYSTYSTARHANLYLRRGLRSHRVLLQWPMRRMHHVYPSYSDVDDESYYPPADDDPDDAGGAVDDHQASHLFR